MFRFEKEQSVWDFNGTKIGTFAGGTSTNDLVVTLNSSATPMTMNVSARLKAGQYRKSRKSVTWPRRTRSMTPSIR